MDFKDKLLMIYSVIMSSIGEVVYNFDSVLLWKIDLIFICITFGSGGRQMLGNSHENARLLNILKQTAEARAQVVKLTVASIPLRP